MGSTTILDEFVQNLGEFVMISERGYQMVKHSLSNLSFWRFWMSFVWMTYAQLNNADRTVLGNLRPNYLSFSMPDRELVLRNKALGLLIVYCYYL